MSVFARLLSVDQRLTRRLQVAEKPGKRRAVFSVLAHSGDFVVLAGRAGAALAGRFAVLARVGGKNIVRHPGDGGGGAAG